MQPFVTQRDIHTTEKCLQMGVVSSGFHRPYVHFTYIDIRRALTLAHNNISCGEGTVRSRSFVTPNSRAALSLRNARHCSRRLLFK